MTSQQKADKILEVFIKNCGSKDDAINKVIADVDGEPNEFTAKGLDGYMIYGQGLVSIFVDDEEEPYTLSVNNVQGYNNFCWD